MAKNKTPVAGSKAVGINAENQKSLTTKQKAKPPRHLGKAGRLTPANTQQEQLSGSEPAQQQNHLTETRQGMPRPGYKRKGVVLPDVMIRELKHRAVDLGITDSELVERAVRAYLETGAGNS